MILVLHVQLGQRQQRVYVQLLINHVRARSITAHLVVELLRHDLVHYVAVDVVKLVVQICDYLTAVATRLESLQNAYDMLIVHDIVLFAILFSHALSEHVDHDRIVSVRANKLACAIQDVVDLPQIKFTASHKSLLQYELNVLEPKVVHVTEAADRHNELGESSLAVIMITTVASLCLEGL